MNDMTWMDLILRNWKKIAGGLTGLFVGIIFVAFGFWRGLFILICVSAGVFLGWHLDAGDGLDEIKRIFRYPRR